MNFFSRLFQPLRNAAAAFFRHDLALRRAEGGVRIVLEQRQANAAKSAPSAREDIAQRKEKQELALIRQQLAELLGDLPETRQTLRHLVFVEQALAKKGLRALQRLPLDVLQRALEQLEGVVTNWSPMGLANLRSKMAVAIIERERTPDAETDAYRTAAVTDHPLLSKLPEVLVHSDDAALAAAYAGLAGPPEAAVEVQGELGSPSARAAARDAARPKVAVATEVPLRELHG